MTTNLAAVYLKAADIIRTNGHYKGAYWGRPESGVGVELSPRECPSCVAGAISIALTDWPVPHGVEDGELDDFNEAVLRLNELLGLEPDPMLIPVGRLAAWNDTEDRTPDEVIAALENAAKQVA